MRASTPEQEIVERFLALFEHRWPQPAELHALLTPDVRFVERPNMLNPTGSERDLAGIEAGAAAGPRVLRWQHYEVRDHCQSANVVATRFAWSGELAVNLGEWPSGTVLRASCVGHYVIADGRIAAIEQHDCYERP